MRVLFVVPCMLYACIPYAQTPDTLWTRTYGGPSEERGYCVQQTSDQGYIMAGYTYSFGAGVMDCYVVKADSFGNIQWTKTYGGSNDDRAFSVQETTDGGYIITGSTKSYGTSSPSVYLIKVNPVGDIVWTKTFGPSSMNNVGYAVQQTSDGGYIIGGTTVTHVLMIKTDGNGNAQWIKEYGTDGYSGGSSVQQTSDGGYIIAGFFYVPGNYDFYLVKTDSLGDTLWTETYGWFDYDACYSVQETTDGGYIAAGGTGILYDRYGADMFLVKTDSHGGTLWTSRFGSDNDDVAFAIHQTTNGSYIVVGRTYSILHANWDIYVVKTDQQGDTVWSRKYGDYGAQWAHSVDITSDGGYIIGGWTTSNACDMYLLKMAPDPYGAEEKTCTLAEHSILTINPNPFTDQTNITLHPKDDCQVTGLAIYDITGRLVKDFHPVRNATTLSWNGTDEADCELPGGVYFLELQAGHYITSEKLLLIR